MLNEWQAIISIERQELNLGDLQSHTFFSSSWKWWGSFSLRLLQLRSQRHSLSHWSLLSLESVCVCRPFSTVVLIRDIRVSSLYTSNPWCFFWVIGTVSSKLFKTQWVSFSGDSNSFVCRFNVSIIVSIHWITQGITMPHIASWEKKTVSEGSSQEMYLKCREKIHYKRWLERGLNPKLYKWYGSHIENEQIHYENQGRERKEEEDWNLMIHELKVLETSEQLQRTLLPLDSWSLILFLFTHFPCQWFWWDFQVFSLPVFSFSSKKSRDILLFLLYSSLLHTWKEKTDECSGQGTQSITLMPEE